ncbi:MAG: hypothetical protein R3C68_04780 [Myxococcota bacterium]
MPSGYGSWDRFHDEVLKARVGPLASPVEDMADEMFQQEHMVEFDTLWDAVDDEE